jgi:hypothetical protein
VGRQAVVGYLRYTSRAKKALLVVAIASVVVALTIVVVDVSRPEGLSWANQHSWTIQMASNVVVLLVTYLIVDQVANAREQSRWREVAWDALESFADGLYDFLRYAEYDWIAMGRRLGPPSDAAVGSGQRLVRDIERRGTMLAHILPASPELATFLDPLAQVLRTLRRWEEAAVREATGSYEDEPYGFVLGDERMSRFDFVEELLYVYRELTPDIKRYLHGNYFEGSVWEEDELRLLDEALAANK